MASAGDYEREPLIPQTDETGGGDNDGAATPGGNLSMGFDPGKPGAESTPAKRLTMFNTAGEDTFQFPETPGLSTTNFAENQLEKWYPNYDKKKIFVVMENDTLKVRLLSGKKLESLFISSIGRRFDTIIIYEC